MSEGLACIVLAIIEFSVSNVSESPVGKRLHWFCETQ